MKNLKPGFFYLFFALVFLAGCVGETLPTATPSETSPDISYDIRVVVQNMDAPLDSRLIKGVQSADKPDDQINLTIYEAESDAQVALFSTLLSESPDGIAIFTEDAAKINSILDSVKNHKTSIVLIDQYSGYFREDAFVDEAGLAEEATRLASKNVEKTMFFVLIEAPSDRYSGFYPPSPNDYLANSGLTPISDYSPYFWITQNTSQQLCAYLQDQDLALPDGDLTIFTRTEEWLLQLIEIEQVANLKRNVSIIGYSTEYIFTEKTYNAMRENPDIFIGVVCTNFFEMGKRSAEGIAAYLDGKSSEEVAAYFDLPFHTITNKTLDEPDVQVFLREMDVLSIRR